MEEKKHLNVITPVCGEGKVLWDIIDFYGTLCSVTTESYFVPSATIRLISSHVYIITNNTAKMILYRSGLLLTLKCGPVLHFQINLSHKLPNMLTQYSLDRGRAPVKETGLKIPTLKVKCKNKSSLKMSTFRSGFYSSGTVIHNTVIEHSVLERSNRNLNPTQQELLKWHCRWSHVSFDHVSMIPVKPHQQKSSLVRGELECQMVVPTNSSASTCTKYLCTACLFAKAKKIFF